MPTGISNGNHNHNRSHREFVKYWEEEGYKADLKARQDALDEDLKRAYQALIAIDPEGGEAWYDDDDNVPLVANTLRERQERIDLVLARVEELEAKKEAGRE